uniref:Dual specificity phosphatase 27 n=1 Tax=Sinocyclocheilus rhinocerous TaxID=307959 RepID=A0A673NBI9_9TELE
MIDDRSPYNTPCVLDIQRVLIQDRLEAPFNPVDEVWPNIAEKSVAMNKACLKRLGITRVVNAAHGTGVYTGEVFYQGMNITYMGIEVDDFPDADISSYFRTCAEFLDDALLTHRGEFRRASMMGVSRSAVLVAAYLMIFQNMSIMEALLEIRKKRAINPNEGFVKQLRQLNETLMEEQDEDDDGTLSQCSVIYTRARLDEEESMFGVKADSIMVDEEEDSGSIISSAAAAALKAGLLGDPSKPDMEVTVEDPSLPGKDGEDEDGDVDSMIREWQKRNEKYQNEDWWEAQLMCNGGDNESLLGNRKQPAVRPEDLESVTSEDVRMVKEHIRRQLRRPASNAGSTTSCSSYSNLWKQCLKEIEEQVAAETEAPAPSLEDVNLTAYQTWKLKHQKKYGGEKNKDEILEMSRAEDPATIKRRQRREKLLERTRKTLEESQSVCGWESESALSVSIPLSAFCVGAFPSASITGDDNMSGRSSALSGRSNRSQPPVPQEPTPMVNITNIQNWIANVVNETLMQKQAEMMMGVSLASSDYKGRVHAFCWRSIQPLLSVWVRLTLKQDYYNQDQVNLHKLDTMEKEIKSDMLDKMASNEVKKIAEDNKRSTSNDEWFKNLRPPQSKLKPYDGNSEPPHMSRPLYGEIEEHSEFDFPSHRSSISVNDDEEEEYSFVSRFSSRHRADDDMDLSRDPSSEINCQSQGSPPSSYNSLGEDTSYRTRRSYARYEDEERCSYQNYSAKQKSSHGSLYENNKTARTDKTRQEEEKDEEISAFIAQIKQRARARVAEEMEDDEILSPWRKQKGSKSHIHSKN